MRILISAYGCAPGRGSEPGVGWNWSCSIAQEHEVWVLLPGAEREAISGAPVPPKNLQFVFCDLPWRIRLPVNPTVQYHIEYYCWQILAFFVARRLHKKVKFDVIHHLTLGTHWKPSLLCLLPVPFIWGPVGGAESAPPSFVRSFPFKERLYEHLRHFIRSIGEMDPLVRVTARRSALALAKSNETAARLRRMGAKNVEVCTESGLSLNELKKFSSMPARKGPPFRVVSCGRMLHWKGFEFGLRAFATLLKSGVQAEYWLIGDGPYRARLTAIAAEVGISSQVHFWGTLDRSEVLAKVAECDVLVHPSLHDSGGWVCVEAMAAGRPVVCLDLGGPSVQVTTETGFRIPAENPESAVREIAAVLQRLAENPDLRIRMGASARGHIQEHFTWERTRHKASNMYRRCVLGSL